VTERGVWEQRWHPLREEWLIVAAHRQDRPWDGAVSEELPDGAAGYASDCYLCPGNTRVNGIVNPRYRGVYAFDNDQPAVGADATAGVEPAGHGLYRRRAATGRARVLCYTERHDLSLAELDVDGIESVMAEWQRERLALAAQSDVAHVLTFENRGRIVGVSSPHPHCQIYATNFVFKTIETEIGATVRHWQETGRPLFQDIIDAEVVDGRRIVDETDEAIAFVPYFARYAYETYVAPRASHGSIAELSDAERRALAAMLRSVLVRYDNLWQTPFPYVMVLHEAPTKGPAPPGFHFHIELHPPLRKPGLVKYLAGPEIGGGNFLSDTCAEDKAAELRLQSLEHYRATATGA
jgi:UDPglucose--hexose-1-phosphate uridylyltransferase